jgi:toxin ParE1/3/4
VTYRIEFTSYALSDLHEIQTWVEDQSADKQIALAYRKRITDRIAALDSFPARGTPREDIGAGVRTFSFERRLIIAYRLIGEVVVIERVINGRRELGGLL